MTTNQQHNDRAPGDDIQLRPDVTTGARRAQYSHVAIVWAIAILAFPLSRLFSSSFPSTSLLSNTLVIGLFLVVVSWGQGLVILTGGIDLSVAAGVSVGAYFTGYFEGIPTGLAIIIGLAVASIIGIVNGLIVAFLDYPPFIVTVATGTIGSGLLLGFSSGSSGVASPPALVQFFDGSNSILGVPLPVMLLVVLVLLGWWIQSGTTFGRKAYALGSNPRAARISGISVRLNLVITYWSATVAYGLAGVLLLGYGSGSNLNIGDDWLLPSIAAVVVGGSSISGGSGSFLGTVGAGLLLTELGIDIGAAGYPEGVKQILYGGVIVLALFFTALHSRK